jgi:hypothetical protein
MAARWSGRQYLTRSGPRQGTRCSYQLFVPNAALAAHLPAVPRADRECRGAGDPSARASLPMRSDHLRRPPHCGSLAFAVLSRMSLATAGSLKRLSTEYPSIVKSGCFSSISATLFQPAERRRGVDDLDIPSDRIFNKILHDI